jgi:hypothetical protein|tara:strand:+ start:571 stop:825 length:255 start_codon:yes stop_codon:yes gene_type:complete
MSSQNKGKKKKPNLWKRFTILLVIFCLLLVAGLYYQDSKKVTLTQGFSIDKEDFSAMLAIYMDQPFTLCDLISENCILLKRRSG